MAAVNYMPLVPGIAVFGSSGCIYRTFPQHSMRGGCIYKSSLQHSMRGGCIHKSPLQHSLNLWKNMECCGELSYIPPNLRGMSPKNRKQSRNQGVLQRTKPYTPRHPADFRKAGGYRKNQGTSYTFVRCALFPSAEPDPLLSALFSFHRQFPRFCSSLFVFLHLCTS